MECYICFEEYTTIVGKACETCKKTCCGKCYMQMFIKARTIPKCGLCRHDPNRVNMSLAMMERMIVINAMKCGFRVNEALEFKKHIAEMRAK
jgi:hypothetical protein